jgi:GNAT superfamily N-acetyltransferase
MDVQCRVFSAADADEMAELLGDAFSYREPIGIAIGMTPVEFSQMVHALVKAEDVQRLSIVARRSDTGEMVGALVCEDAASDSSAGLENWGEKFAMVGSILGELATRFGPAEHPRLGETVHAFLLGVRDGAEGNGVGQALVAASKENGARIGYRSAVAECTGRTSQHIFRKLGFVDRGMVPYAEHEYEGRRVFESVAEHGGPILMEAVL